MQGLRTVIYHVGNIDKAKLWYSKALQKEPYFDQPFYVGFNIGGYELGLSPESTPTTDKTTTVVGYWGVTDIQSQYQRLLDLGASANVYPQNVGGEIVVASVKDPWGNVLGIIYNPDFRVEE